MEGNDIYEPELFVRCDRLNVDKFLEPNLYTERDGRKLLFVFVWWIP